MYLVFSTSLHPNSRSHVLANAAVQQMQEIGLPCELLDLAALDQLPPVMFTTVTAIQSRALG